MRATAKQKRLRKKYTRVVKIGDEWDCYLQIDHQGFLVVQSANKSRAIWYSKMLSIALERMIENERPKP
jgi:hypothetical protein